MTRTLNLIALVVFACSLFMRSTDPVIPQIAFGLKVEPATAALLTSAFTLPYALNQPILGALGDAMSKARLMLACVAIVATATIVCGLAQQFEVLLGARMVAGMAAGGVVPIAFALVGDMVPVTERQVTKKRLLFAIMTGNLLGATFAGIVSDLAGWRGMVFSLGGFGLIVLAAAVPGFRGLKETPGAFDLKQIVRNYRLIFRNPLAKICFGAVFLEGLFMYGAFPHLATMMHDAGETRAGKEGQVKGGVGKSGALNGVFVSRLLPVLGERGMMRYGGLGMGLCLAGIAAMLPWPIEFANFMLLGFAFYSLHAVIQIYASELEPSARGTAKTQHTENNNKGQADDPAKKDTGLSSSLGIKPLLLMGALVIVGVG